MDTLTQALLGGAVGYLVTRKTSPRKGLLMGAAMGIAPDLDIFIPQANVIDAMTLHRSWSHSWLIQTLLSPVAALLLYQCQKELSFKRVWLLVWLAWVTHSGLDALTVYGTQLLWPFMPSPISGGSIFIIDPFYSLPLLISFVFILFSPLKPISQQVMNIGFVFSTGYLIVGLIAQQAVTTVVKTQLHEQGASYQHVHAIATPFNILFWRVLVINDGTYSEGFGSLLNLNRTIPLQQYDRGKELAKQLANNPFYERLKWFTHDDIKVEQINDDMIVSDLRMGSEPHYFFRLKVASRQDEHLSITPPERVTSEFNRVEALKSLWQKLVHPDDME
jgi:inner membrane protein